MSGGLGFEMCRTLYKALIGLIIGYVIFSILHVYNIYTLPTQKIFWGIERLNLNFHHTIFFHNNLTILYH